MCPASAAAQNGLCRTSGFGSLGLRLSTAMGIQLCAVLCSGFTSDLPVIDLWLMLEAKQMSVKRCKFMYGTHTYRFAARTHLNIIWTKQNHITKNLCLSLFLEFEHRQTSRKKHIGHTWSQVTCQSCMKVHGISMRQDFLLVQAEPMVVEKSVSKIFHALRSHIFIIIKKNVCDSEVFAMQTTTPSCKGVFHFLEDLPSLFLLDCPMRYEYLGVVSVDKNTGASVSWSWYMMVYAILCWECLYEYVIRPFFDMVLWQFWLLMTLDVLLFLPMGHVS